MGHWSSKYIGRPYVKGEYDCLDLVLEIVEKEYGINTCIISNHGDCTLEQQRELYGRLEDYAETIDEPIDGCGVLMRQGKRLRHLGIYYKKKSTGYIIHNSLTAKMVVQSLDYRIGVHGYTIDRYLKWSKK